MLPASNRNNRHIRLRGILLKSQLYGRAKVLCANISPSVISSDKGAHIIVAAVQKQDALFVVLEMYHNLFDLLHRKRRPPEMFRSNQTRFLAQMSKFNSHFSKITLPEYILGWLLLYNVSATPSQSISILSAPVFQGSRSLNSTVTDSSASESTIAGVIYTSEAQPSTDDTSPCW